MRYHLITVRTGARVIYCTVGNFAFQAVNPYLIPGIPYGLPSVSGVISEHRAKNNP